MSEHSASIQAEEAGGQSGPTSSSGVHQELATKQIPWRGILRLPVIVAALGYMVDMYDIFLFNIVRVPSLKDLGLTDE